MNRNQKHLALWATPALSALLLACGQPGAGAATDPASPSTSVRPLADRPPPEPERLARDRVLPRAVLDRAARFLAGLPEVERAWPDEDGTGVWAEFAQLRTDEERATWLALRSERGRAMVRKAMNDAEAPLLTEQDAAILQYALDDALHRVTERYGYDARAVLGWQSAQAAWADQVLVDTTPVTPNPQADGTPASHYAPGDAVYRFACCDDLEVRESASANSPVVGTLSRNESVVVTDVVASTGLGGLINQIESCLPDSCGDLASLLEGVEINLYAEVKATVSQDLEGYVPLVSLFVSPREAVSDKAVFQASYNRIVDGLFTGLRQVYAPDGCDTTGDTIEVEVGALEPDVVFNDLTGAVHNCSERLACIDGDGQVDTFKCRGKSTCDTCRDLFEAAFGEGGLYDDDVAHDTAAGQAYLSQCGFYVGKGETKSFLDPQDYTCGEYPVGMTHYRGQENADRKLLYSARWWHKDHDITMARKAGQKSVTFATFDLDLDQDVIVESTAALQSKNLWVALEPLHEAPYQPGLVLPQDYNPMEGHSLLVHACGHMPGLAVYGPNVDYPNDKTPMRLIDEIHYGNMTVDRVDFCALGKLTLEDDFTPTLTWMELTDFRLDGMNLGGIRIKYNAAMLFLLFVVGSAFLLISPTLGSIITSLIASVLTLSVALPGYLELTENDEWVIEDLLPETTKALLFDKVVRTLNDATADALEGVAVPDVDQELADVCAQQIPTVEEGNPLHYFYEYLRQQCESFHDTARLVPFMPHQASVARPCYGADRFFSPRAAVEDPLVDNEGSWLQSFEGQGWYEGGAAQDVGCRLDFDVWGKVDKDLWPVLQCMVSRVNLALNRDPAPASLGADIAAACADEGRAALMSLYGTGEDLLPLLESGGGYNWSP